MWGRVGRGRGPRRAPAGGDELLARALVYAASVALRAPVARAVEDVTGRLVAEDLPRNAWLDGGVWAWAAYRGAAAAALRAHQVSLLGDEIA
jgi:hypothetical protein